MSRINWTFLSALCLAGISLYFSAHGLASLFAGIGTASIVLAIFFEFAKVTTTLYLIWNWGLRLLPILLAGCVMILVLISSAGIYGYLRGAYQEGRIGQAESSGEIGFLEEQIRMWEADRDRLYSLVDALPETHSTNRLRTLAEVQPQIQELNAKIEAKRGEMISLRLGEGHTPGHYAPAAEMLGVSETQLVSALITTLALLLDPLAVLLVLASGVHLPRREEEQVQSEVEWIGTAMTQEKAKALANGYRQGKEEYDKHLVGIADEVLGRPKSAAPKLSSALRRVVEQKVRKANGKV